MLLQSCALSRKICIPTTPYRLTDLIFQCLLLLPMPPCLDVYIRVNTHTRKTKDRAENCAEPDFLQHSFMKSEKTTFWCHKYRYNYKSFRTGSDDNGQVKLFIQINYNIYFVMCRWKMFLRHSTKRICLRGCCLVRVHL
jgi:hypothetical protein